MELDRQFHVDRGDHSVTVQLFHRLTLEAEVLVDGKVVAFRRLSGAGPHVLTAELPGEPAQPFEVELHGPRAESDTWTCLMRIDGQETAMPQRRAA